MIKNNNIKLLCLWGTMLFLGHSFTMAQSTNTDRDVPDQRNCGTTEFTEYMLENDRDFYEQYQQGQEIKDYLANSNLRMACENPLIIPVAVHYGSPVTNANPQCLVDAALAQIEQMNLDFASCNSNISDLCAFAEACPDYFDVPIDELLPDEGSCIQFCLADQNLPAGEDNIGDYGITVGDYTWTGNNGDASPAWNGYLNIFVGDYLGGGTLGIAPLFGASNPQGDGVYVIASAFGSQTFNGCTSGTGIDTGAPYNGGATCTHEVGHYFGLEHTWDDNLADTPAHNSPNYGCPSFNNGNCTTGGDDGYSANFMDYVDDDCMSSFTEDQANLMVSVGAAQSEWATNSISCFNNYVYTSCQGPCGAECPTAVTNQWNGSDDFCSTTGTINLNNVGANPTLDIGGSQTYTWSIGNYLTTGGTAIVEPTSITPITSSLCNIETQTFYLNVDCALEPLATTLNGGTYTVTVYPGPPSDISSLVTISNENTCSEPSITPIAGCESYISITPSATNPSFPVSNGSNGNASYSIEFISNPAGPECCVTDSGSGELVSNGNFDNSNADWTEYVEQPNGTVNSSVTIIDNTGNINGSEAWFGGFTNSYMSITQDIIIPDCSNVTLNFDYFFEECAGNDNDFLEIFIGTTSLGVIQCTNATGTTAFTPLNIMTIAGINPGPSTISFVGVETPQGGSGANGDSDMYIDNISLIASGCTVPAACDIDITASYDCQDAECTDCNDTACTTTIPCNDDDCTTENDMQTVLISDNSVICEVCAGTAITPPNCDDGCPDTADSYNTSTCECENTLTEPSCDDGCPDTTDTYDANNCQCVNTLIEPNCDDNDCTTEDSYNAATCQCVNTAITPPDCDDNDCTTSDVYNTTTCQCENNPVEPNSCDDNDCTTEDSYDELACECVNTPITPPDCDDNDCTTEDSYNTTTCQCVNTPITPPDCDDNDCTTEDIYNTTTCQCVNTTTTPPDCDDNDCNTEDSYDSTNCECVNTAITPPDCDDNDCTTEDSYDVVACECVNTLINPPNCDDNDCLTADVYNIQTCECENNPIEPGACDDGDCTTEDSYDTDLCECVFNSLAEPDCDDNDCSTEDSYDSLTCECINTAIPTPDCNDANCLTVDSYNTATCECENTPLEEPDCDDNDCTTEDSLDGITCQCINTPIELPNCDDNDCNTADVYNTATCECENNPVQPGACDDEDCTTEDSYDEALCECIHTPIDPPSCDDGDCNTTGVFDEELCECIYTTIDEPICDDEDCTTADSYNSTTCECEYTTITPPECNDNDCNTADVYNPDTCECENNPVEPGACDDNDCTTEDTYNSDTCECEYITIEAPSCDDNDCSTEDTYNTDNCECEYATIDPPSCNDNDCTTEDTYDADNCECVYTDLATPDCNDDDCNTADVYNTATCECENNPIEPGACDDNDCNTEDSYDEVACECINTPIPTPNCDDNDCNTEDSYNSNTCECEYITIDTPNCDDGNCLTTDVYNTATCQCEYNAIDPAPCDDGDDCTSDDFNSETCDCTFTPIPDCGGSFDGITISSRVWLDENQNGVQDPDEIAGVEGVLITLYDADGNIVDTATTDAAGNYTFENVDLGFYYLGMSIPANYLSSPAGNSGNNSMDSDFNSQGFTEEFEVAANTTDLSYDAGLIPTDCTEFTVDHFITCAEEAGIYSVTIAAFSDEINTFSVTSTHENGFNGTFDNSFIDGPFDIGTSYSYTITIPNQEECNQTVAEQAVECTTVDISLIKFEGEVLNNGNELSWQTANEIDNDHFLLEKSTDGINFETIATIDSKGNNANNYDFLDAELRNGVYYYRLNSVNTDGTQQYEGNVVALVREGNNSEIQTIYPIPVEDAVTLTINAPIDNPITIDIYDIKGRLVQQLPIKLTAGENNLNIQVDNYSTGIYFISFIDNNVRQVAKFVKK